MSPEEAWKTVRDLLFEADPHHLQAKLDTDAIAGAFRAPIGAERDAAIARADQAEADAAQRETNARADELEKLLAAADDRLSLASGVTIECTPHVVVSEIKERIAALRGTATEEGP